jgi:tetratricopeptide (TPR) repeat protein
MNLGDEYMGKEETAKALEAYAGAAKMAPEMDEISFWHAVTLADTCQLEAALPIFKKLFTENPDWARLLQRLPAAGMIHAEHHTIQRILDLI